MAKKSEIILINASAGSGKTHALTRRYVRLLLTGAAPESILAVTFTNNAAKEMKQRILDWLKKAAAGKECDETGQLMADTGLKMPALQAAAGAILEHLLSNYYDLHVQTIDSFLNRIALSSAGELGLPLNPDITTSHRRLADVALYSIFSKEGASALSRKEVDDFLDALPPGESYPWDPVEKMRETYENFLAYEGKSDGRIEPAGDGGKALEKAREAVAALSADFLKLLDTRKHAYQKTSKGRGHTSPRGMSPMLDAQDISRGHTLPQGMSPVLEPGAEYYADALKAGVRRAIESGDPFIIADHFSMEYGFFNGNKVKGPGLPDELSKYNDEIAAAVKTFIRLNAYHRLDGFVRIYPKFKDELERIKSGKEDLAHIDDIAKKISSYLRERGEDAVPEVYIRLGERIEHFLIDEFQDTDPLQWRALLPLIREALARGGSLFVVGDIKQAIYMFRYADYRIMRAFMAALESGKGAGDDPLELGSIAALAEKKDRKLEKLEMNRRSGGVLVKYVEDLFQNRLPAYREGELLSREDDPTGLTSYEQSAEEGRKEAGAFRETVVSRKALAEAKKGGEEDDSGDITDAEVSAQVVKIIKDAHKRYRYDQIAVLAPQNENILAVVSWLNAAGIPVASLSSLDIRDRPLVAQLISLFTFLEFPADDIAFLNFACGEIFLKASGLSREDALAAAAEHRHKWHGGLPHHADVWGGPPLYVTFRDRCPGQWEEYFEPLFAKIGYLPAYELASLAFSRFKVFERFREESCFLVKFLEVLSSLQGQGAADARSFIEFARDDGEDAYSAFSIELPEYIDAVRVMTFHKAKGLGFPVVINLLYEKRGRGGSAADKVVYYDGPDEKGRVSIAYIKASDAKWDPKLQKLCDDRRTEERVQALNELYVVTTRAKNELTNIAVRAGEEQSKGSKAKYHYVFGSLEGGSPDPEAKAEPLKHKPSVVEQPVFPEHAAPAPGATLESYRAAQRGLLYHEILMKIDWAAGNMKDRLGRAFDDCAGNYSPSLRGEKAAIIVKLGSLLSKPEVAAFFKERPGLALKREKEFISGPEGGRLRRIDRLLLDGAPKPSKAVIIDFKTGAEYAGYLDTLKKYAAAVSEAYSVPAECWLVYVDEEIAERLI